MIYDLEERSLAFSKSVIRFCRNLKQDSITRPIISQVIRSSGSIGANYIEANECLGKKDFVHRLKIARKEAKETVFWLKNFQEFSSEPILEELIDEAVQLKKIMSAIIEKSN